MPASAASAIVPPETPMSTSAPRSASAMSPVTPRGLVIAASAGLLRVQVVPVRRAARRASRPTTMSPRTPPAISIRVTATPAAPAPLTTTRSSPSLRSEQRGGVAQRGQHDDRGAVLVVVEDRDRQRLVQPALDLEAARRRDVLEVDAAEDWAPARSRSR